MLKVKMLQYFKELQRIKCKRIRTESKDTLYTVNILEESIFLQYLYCKKKKACGDNIVYIARIFISKYGII